MSLYIIVAFVIFSGCSSSKNPTSQDNTKNSESTTVDKNIESTNTESMTTENNTITWATNPQYPPYDWSVGNQEYVGAGPELLSQIIPKGYKLKAVMVPWKRAQEMARTGEIDILVNLRITPERSTWLEFSKNPTFYNPIVVFMLKEKLIPFKSWDELKPLRGGTALGDTYGNGFDEYLAANLKTESASSMVENFKKLTSNRIDYFVSGYYTGMAWVSSAKLSDNIVALTPPVSNNFINLGFSKKSKYLYLLPEMDKKLAELQTNGSSNSLLQKYLDQFSTIQLKDFPQ